MEYIFYIFGFIAIITTMKVILNNNPIYALLYLISSLIALSIIFFIFGAYFAGALEIIIYAGAIMVLFIFVIMILNLNKFIDKQKYNTSLYLIFFYAGISILLISFISIMFYAILTIKNKKINVNIIDAKQVGINLFGPYILIVELISLLLLVGLIVTYHITNTYKSYNFNNNSKN